MKPQSIRMPKDLWSALQQDAERRDRTTAEHVREICRQAVRRDMEDIYSRVDAIEEAARSVAVDPDEPLEVWWAEQVKPFLDVAIEWGLIVQHPGNELEWIGPPE